MSEDDERFQEIVRRFQSGDTKSSVKPRAQPRPTPTPLLPLTRQPRSEGSGRDPSSARPVGRCCSDHLLQREPPVLVAPVRAVTNEDLIGGAGPGLRA